MTRISRNTKKKIISISDGAEAVACAGQEEASAHGSVVEVPLSRLKRSPRNARRTPHSAAHIEALAGSIAAKGMLQKPVVEPERDEAGAFTGFWLATIGEGGASLRCCAPSAARSIRTRPCPASWT